MDAYQREVDRQIYVNPVALGTSSGGGKDENAQNNQ
jgi:hypothetical protein